MIFLVILSAVLPALVLIYLVYQKDKRNPEPSKQLIKAFCFGIFSIVIVEILGPLKEYLLSLFYIPVFSQIYEAFVCAAIPEEAAKLLMLWLFVRKNKYFDEYMDGIVYAVCISMGFAAIENIMYLFIYYDIWVSTGITRALVSVPGHAAFAVLMGYYYSIIHFRPFDTKVNKALIILAPVLAHGIFDALLMVSDILIPLSFVLTMVFFYFFFQLQKRCSNKIAELLVKDLENKRRGITLA